MNDPLDLIEEESYICFKLLLRASATATGNLRVMDGYYYLPTSATAYHPLEAALNCQEVRTGDWRADVMSRLGVSAAWTDGFIDGFAQAAEKSGDPDYQRGFLAAVQLRARRPIMFRE